MEQQSNIMNIRVHFTTVLAGLMLCLVFQHCTASTLPSTTTLINTPANIVTIVSDPVSNLCALYKETGDVRVLALIERIATQKMRLEQTEHVTQTIKNGIWWAGWCTVLYLWWNH